MMMKLMAFVIVPSLPFNVSVPVHCDVGNLLAAVAVGTKIISCVPNMRDRNKRTGSAFIVLLILSPHLPTRSPCPQVKAICLDVWMTTYLFIIDTKQIGAACL